MKDLCIESTHAPITGAQHRHSKQPLCAAHRRDAEWLRERDLCQVGCKIVEVDVLGTASSQCLQNGQGRGELGGEQEPQGPQGDREMQRSVGQVNLCKLPCVACSVCTEGCCTNRKAARQPSLQLLGDLLTWSNTLASAGRMGFRSVPGGMNCSVTKSSTAAVERGTILIDTAAKRVSWATGQC